MNYFGLELKDYLSFSLSLPLCGCFHAFLPTPTTTSKLLRTRGSNQTCYNWFGKSSRSSQSPAKRIQLYLNKSFTWTQYSIQANTDYRVFAPCTLHLAPCNTLLILYSTPIIFLQWQNVTSHSIVTARDAGASEDPHDWSGCSKSADV